jgi:3-hydroxyisobutyrate dehydrogenase/2-hydroxy-3-oxopropionate reductase
MTTVAWIGLGAMGARMARRLADAGHDLTVWNRMPSRADVLAAAGAHVAATPAEAVRDADAVFLMLADPAALGEVTEGAVGIAAGVSAGTTVVDMSTVGPVAVARLGAVLPQGITLLDAPVLGSLAEADAGTLTLLVGGPADAVAQVRPLLSILGDLVHLGPAGSGAAAKLVANFALLGTVAVLGEALAIADGLGLPREVTWRVLAHTPLAAQATRRRAVVESGDFLARFALAMARKDADLIVAAADAASVDVRLARAARSWLADAESAGLGTLDYTAVLDHIPSPRGKPESTAINDAVTTAHVPHYSWGDGCDGWRLVDTAGLSVIEERMPPGTAEEWHMHDRARQFFYVLDGQATIRTLDGDIALHAGAGVQIAPGTPHQMANTCGRDLRFLVINAPSTRGDRRPCPEPLPIGEQA